MATTGQDGCTTMSHLAYFGATFGMDGTSEVSCGTRSFSSDSDRN